MNDREIAEYIVKTGDCDGISCNGHDGNINAGTKCICLKFSCHNKLNISKQWLKNNPKPEAKMITREELIEKIGGKPIEATREVFNAIKDMGFTWGETKRLVDVDLDTKSRDGDCITLYNTGSGKLNKPHICYCSMRSMKISAKEFLSYFEPKSDDQKRTEKIIESNKPTTKREYLLKLVAKMEANKKEFNKTVDEAIEDLHKQMICEGCFIQADGKYSFDARFLSSEVAVKVSEFINRMEADFE